MPLSESQRAALIAEAKRRGIDEAKLLAAAEKRAGDGGGAGARPAPAPAENDRPLYQYHLPFVTVNEVRTIWLGLSPIAGGDENAAKYSAAQLAGQTAKPPVDE